MFAAALVTVAANDVKSKNVFPWIQHRPGPA